MQLFSPILLKCSSTFMFCIPIRESIACMIVLLEYKNMMQYRRDI